MRIRFFKKELWIKDVRHAAGVSIEAVWVEDVLMQEYASHFRGGKLEMLY